MLTEINPKLPMRDKAATLDYYVNGLGFAQCGTAEYPDYLMIQKDNIEIHFFLFKDLDPSENYGQVYIRTDAIDSLYQELISRQIKIRPNGPLRQTLWGQKEFALLDPDNNLLTFGQSAKT